MYPDANTASALVTIQVPYEKVQIECIFGQLFKDSIRSSRTHSIRVIKSLLSLFSGNEASDKHKMVSPLDKVPMLSFTSEVIAYLPYNHLGDVLFIIHNIAGVLSLEGNETMSRLMSFLRPYGLSNDDGDPTEEDKLERAALKPNPSKSKGLGAMTKKSFDAAKFADLCAEASALVLLLRLSDFLREAYSGATHTRVLAYLPGEKERITDRGISQINNVTPFNSKIPSAIAAGSNLFDSDNLICQYAEFRQLMRTYDSSQMVASDEGGNQSDDSKPNGSKRKRADSDNQSDDSKPNGSKRKRTASD